MSTDQRYADAHHPLVAALHGQSGNAVLDHLVAEIQHPETEDAFPALCSACGQPMPEGSQR